MKRILLGDFQMWMQTSARTRLPCFVIGSALLVLHSSTKPDDNRDSRINPLCSGVLSIYGPRNDLTAAVKATFNQSHHRTTLLL